MIRLVEMRILLGAHTINPAGGGEAGIGWGWAESLASLPGVERVTVVAHPMAREQIEARLAADELLREKLRFEWVLPPDRIDPWNGDVPGKKVWHRLLIHYQLWQRYAERAALRLVDRIDLAQHVTFGNIFLRTFVAKLPVPYIIGPVGGGQSPAVSDAAALLARTRDVHGGVELARSLIVRVNAHRPELRRRLGGAVAVLCANSQTLDVARRFQSRSELMIDGGIGQLPPERARLNLDKPTVLWVGKMESRKDPLAVVDVAEHLRTVAPAVRVRVVGDGWLRERLRRDIDERRLGEVIELVGTLPHEQMATVYASASVFLFTSRRDTFGVQNLEAMSHGLPIIYRDSPGVGVADFAGDSAVPVPTREFPREAAVEIAHLTSTPDLWNRISNTARDRAAELTWTVKARRLFEIASSALGRP